MGSGAEGGAAPERSGRRWLQGASALVPLLIKLEQQLCRLTNLSWSQVLQAA